MKLGIKRERQSVLIENPVLFLSLESRGEVRRLKQCLVCRIYTVDIVNEVSFVAAGIVDARETV